MDDWINRKNAGSWHVPSVLLRVLLAWLLSAIVLAIAVPLLIARQIELAGWMVWVVILATLALAVGPDLLARLRKRS